MERAPLSAYMRAPSMKRMKAVPNFSERAFWHGKEKQYLISLIITQSTEEDTTMNLEELKSKSTSELLKLYNSMADRQVKRFASRADAERRTAELLRDQAEASGKAEKVANKVVSKNADKTSEAPASKKATKANSKKPVSKKADGNSTRGAPRKERAYKPISEGSKLFNPDSLTLHAKSGRSIVFDKIKAKPGITRRELEDKCDADVNVLGALSYLTKHGFVTAAEQA